VAIYSRLKQWEGEHWISVAKGGEVVLEIGQRIIQTLLLQSPPFESPLSLWITVDPVPHERSVLQVEWN